MGGTKQHVAVIGAGVIGMSCALWLQKKGFEVTLADGNEPGSITSSGNACTIADYACIPINDPGLFRRLPSLIFRRDRLRRTERGGHIWNGTKSLGVSNEEKKNL